MTRTANARNVSRRSHAANSTKTGPISDPLVSDTEPLVAYIANEDGSDDVEEYLDRVEECDVSGFVSLKVDDDGVFLPSPEGGEKYTQLDCPDCSCPLSLTVETATPDAVGVDMRLGVDWNVDASPRSQITQTLL